MPDVRVGVQRPRLSNVPQGVRSDGADAIELAALCGLFLDPWQQYVLEGLFQRRPDDQWVTKNGLLVVPRQNGKGAVLEAWELARLFLFGEQEVLHTAHHDRTVRDGFSKMVNRIQSSQVLAPRLMQDRSKGVRVANGQRSITFNTGQQLTYATRSSGAGRGQTLDAVVLDEVQHLDDEELESLSSTIATRPLGQVMMAGSAPIPGKSESLRRLVTSGRGGSSQLTYFEWSLDENQAHDLDDPGVWAQANPGYGYRLFDDPFHSDRVLLTDEGFAREHLGIVETDGLGVFPPGVWESLADQQEIDSPTFCLEVSEDRQWSCIGAAGDGPNGVQVELGDNRPGVDWVVPRAVELDRKNGGVPFVVQKSAAAGALIPALKDAGLRVVEMSQADYVQACGMFYDRVVSRGLRHANQAAVNTAVRGVEKKPAGDSWKFDRRGKIDPIPFTALSNAAWSHEVNGSASVYEDREMVTL